jgi:hypothetical protein
MELIKIGPGQDNREMKARQGSQDMSRDRGCCDRTADIGQAKQDGKDWTANYCTVGHQVQEI